MKFSFKGTRKKNEILAPYVAYRVGGPAQDFLVPQDEADVISCLIYAHQTKTPLKVLGSGTNLLIRDGGVEGMVLFLGAGLKGDIEILEENEQSLLVRVPGHWPKAKLLSLALAKSWGGLEFSAGIPGTMGGAVYMNAGTKWGAYGDVIEKVRLYNVEHGLVEQTKEQMKFKYRGHGEGLLKSSTVVLSADLRLMKSKLSDIRKLVDEILSYRGSKQPLELPNCGSVFKNPENSEKGAGRLIEAAGLKGTTIGNAQISLKHANFILNLGGAKASDIEGLINLAQSEVAKKFSINLETEVIILGKQLNFKNQSAS